MSATTFTISRILSAWRRSGLAEVKREHILIRDARRLREIGAGHEEIEAHAPPAPAQR